MILRETTRSEEDEIDVKGVFGERVVENAKENTSTPVFT
jgi:hypothetical protein